MDVSADNPSNLQTLAGRIKQSKTDPYRTGVKIFLSKTDTELCPVAELLAYLVARPGSGQAFCFFAGITSPKHNLDW